MDKIYIVDKPPGLTSKDFADTIKEKHSLRKICYCGRLDPMARGKMLLLGDEFCKQMEKHKGHNKTYQFEICFGIQTDTDDPLGIITNYVKEFDQKEIYDKLNQILATYQDKEFNQNFHRYSSICLDGKPYWLLTKEQQTVDKIPNHRVKIDSIKEINYYKNSFQEFKKKIMAIIGSIDQRHNFRQDEIVEQWKSFEDFDENIFSIHLEANVSSGFYVRQFIQDLSDQLGFPLMVYDINRTNINFL